MNLAGRTQLSREKSFPTFRADHHFIMQRILTNAATIRWDIFKRSGTRKQMLASIGWTSALKIARIRFGASSFSSAP